MKKLLFTIFILIFFLNLVNAQTKYEKEYRINTEEVPQPALEFVKALNFTKKIKWYKEEGLDKISIEAKTKHLSRNYSIEFSKTGVIEDIEIKINTSEIPTNVYQSITQLLSAKYQKVKFSKIQLQLSGDQESMAQSINNQDFETNELITKRYEIELKAKENGKFQKFEFLFDHNGELLSKAIILLKNSDILEF